MDFASAFFSEKGPREVNEDSVSVWNLDDSTLVAAVADGLGGMGGGVIASEAAINQVTEEIFAEGFGVADLSKVARHAHERILALQKSTKWPGMATTFSCVRLSNRVLRGVHCGDTRISVCRGNGIKKLTQDQTEASRLFDAGQITKGELKNYPRRHIVDSALGTHRELVLQEIEFVIEAGDKILMTSDGVHEKVSMTDFRDVAIDANDPAIFCSHIRSLVEKRGPSDNFSLVCIFVS